MSNKQQTQNMSFGGGGGKTRFTTKVLLNVYDLVPANDFLYPLGLGFHHAGVEILGTEYSFASGAGIFESPPKMAPGARFREQLLLGSFDGGTTELQRALDELRPDFGPEDYNLIRRNCNHFANSLSWRLLHTTIPGHINRLADMGLCCSCLLPRSLLENAPVGDPHATTTTTTTTTTADGSPQPQAIESRFMVRPGRSTASSTVHAFSGSGARLGSANGKSSTEQKGLLNIWSSSTTSSSSGSQQDDLTDRRERARKAALARLERNQEKES